MIDLIVNGLRIYATVIYVIACSLGAVILTVRAIANVPKIMQKRSMLACSLAFYFIAHVALLVSVVLLNAIGVPCTTEYMEISKNINIGVRFFVIIEVFFTIMLIYSAPAKYEALSGKDFYINLFITMLSPVFFSLTYEISEQAAAWFIAKCFPLLSDAANNSTVSHPVLISVAAIGALAMLAKFIVYIKERFKLLHQICRESDEKDARICRKG